MAHYLETDLSAAAIERARIAANKASAKASAGDIALAAAERIEDEAMGYPKTSAVHRDKAHRAQCLRVEGNRAHRLAANLRIQAKAAQRTADAYGWAA